MDSELLELFNRVFESNGFLGVALAMYWYRENQTIKFHKEQLELKKEISQEFSDVLKDIKDSISTRGCKNYEK